MNWASIMTKEESTKRLESLIYDWDINELMSEIYGYELKENNTFIFNVYDIVVEVCVLFRGECMVELALNINKFHEFVVIIEDFGFGPWVSELTYDTKETILNLKYHISNRCDLSVQDLLDGMR